MDLNEIISDGIAEVLGEQQSTIPSVDEVNQYRLEKKRVVYLDFDVCPETTAIHRQILLWNMEDKDKPVEERKPIWLYIISWGGDLSYMWMLIDLIRTSKTPVYTVNIGIAASAAALIFLAGHKRYMTENSVLMIHEGSASMDGDAGKILDMTESYKIKLKKMKEFIEKRTSIPHSTVMKKRSHDWELDAKYCLENNACDEIIQDLEVLAV